MKFLELDYRLYWWAHWHRTGRHTDTILDGLLWLLVGTCTTYAGWLTPTEWQAGRTPSLLQLPYGSCLVASSASPPPSRAVLLDKG
jgi:hypothetical protein